MWRMNQPWTYVTTEIKFKFINELQVTDRTTYNELHALHSRKNDTILAFNYNAHDQYWCIIHAIDSWCTETTE